MNTRPSPTQAPRLPRLSGWLLITLILSACVWALAPQQLPVSLYKLSLVTLAAVVGYWLDRSLFPYARPDKFEKLARINTTSHTVTSNLLDAMNWACLRRAVIVGCAMLAMGLGA
ncbi:MAG: putative holin [Rhodoferax sp.]